MTIHDCNIVKLKNGLCVHNKICSCGHVPWAHNIDGHCDRCFCTIIQREYLEWSVQAASICTCTIRHKNTSV